MHLIDQKNGPSHFLSKKNFVLQKTQRLTDWPWWWSTSPSLSHPSYLGRSNKAWELPRWQSIFEHITYCNIDIIFSHHISSCKMLQCQSLGCPDLWSSIAPQRSCIKSAGLESTVRHSVSETDLFSVYTFELFTCFIRDFLSFTVLNMIMIYNDMIYM